MLRCFGAHVEGDVHIHPSVRIAMPWNLTLRSQCAVGDRAILYALGCIEVGARATVSQGAHLCAGTHDHRRADRPLLTPPIQVGADSWIAADAFIGPGVCVGQRCIVGARAVVMKSVCDGQMVAGNPARVLDTC
jgi:putative colanic acid biosynthesis acetyltransferase WcaF